MNVPIVLESLEALVDQVSQGIENKNSGTADEVMAVYDLLAHLARARRAMRDAKHLSVDIGITLKRLNTEHGVRQ